MARKTEDPKPKSDVPSWFMTYSDVITLLMTFFILLLTFATTEPERFEKIQVAMFGGAGSTGIVGEHPEAAEQDSWTLRTRPPSARMCLDGSEMPPLNSDPALNAPAKSLAGLDDDENISLSHQFAVEIDFKKLVSANGKIYSIGKLYAKMFAKQLYRLPMHITFEVHGKSDRSRAVHFAHYIFREFGVKPGQMGVRMVSTDTSQKSFIIIEHFLHDPQRAGR